MKLKVLVPDPHLRELDVERGVTGALIDHRMFDETDAAAIPDDDWASCDAIRSWSGIA